MSVYIDELKTEFLPLNCNWITSNLLPKFDENKNTFVEPFLPNHKLRNVAGTSFLKSEIINCVEMTRLLSKREFHSIG